MKNTNQIYTKRLLNYTSTKEEYDRVEARLEYGSNTKAADALGMPRRTLDRAINRVVERAMMEGADEDLLPKILILDVETAPLKTYMWSLWQNGVQPSAMVDCSYILSWAAKWLGEDQVFADALCYNESYTAGTEDDSRMLSGIWELMNEADCVVAHNGDRFDIKRLNTRFLLAGFPPPNPYKSIDTLKIVKRAFAFDSNKLDHLLKVCFNDSKLETGGFKTWVGCMEGDMDSWEQMIEYNKGDVTKLEDLYLYIRPWDKFHPSAATWGGVSNDPCCTRCGSHDVSKTGATWSTGTGVFDVWECDDCGGKMRTRTTNISVKKRQNLLVNVG